MAWYNDYTHIADIYDTYVQTSFDVPFFKNEASKVTGEVLELMAGTGRLSIPLVQAGVKLTCVDLSPDMLAVLQHKLDQLGLTAEMHVMNVCNLKLARKYSLAIIPFHSFAEILAPEDRLRALNRIYEHLLPGSTFICTLHNPSVRVKSVDGQLKMWGKYPLPDEDGALIFWGQQEVDATGCSVTILEFFEEYDAVGILLSKRFQEIRFCLVTKAEFEEMAAAAGFKVKALYGDYDYAPFDEASSRFMIWILQK